MQNIIIRSETPADHRAVESLVCEAFWNVYRPGCLEHYVLHTFRRDPAFVPELNLVMVRPGEKSLGRISVGCAIMRKNFVRPL